MATQAEIEDRRQAVLKGIAEGKAKVDIAAALGVDRRTIERDAEQLLSDENIRAVAKSALLERISNIPGDVSWQGVVQSLCSVLRIDPQLTEERINELVDARINSQQAGRPTTSGEGIQQPLVPS